MEKIPSKPGVAGLGADVVAFAVAPSMVFILSVCAGVVTTVPAVHAL